MKKGFKKYLSIILMCILVFTLMACGNTSSGKTENITEGNETTVKSKTSSI